MAEVFIDIGHGGSDPGAVYGKDTEKQWNLDTGLACIAELKRHGVTVHTSRVIDKAVSLNERCNLSNRTGSSHFVSIHHNAGKGDRGEVIHSISNSGKPLADKITAELKSAGQSTVKIYSRAGTVNQDYYAVIRGTKAIAVIVEVCFIDNATDRQIADTLAERQRNGVAIAHGILKELKIAIKDNKPATSTPSGKTKYHRVIAGSFTDEQNAKNIEAELKKAGYDAWIDIFYK